MCMFTKQKQLLAEWFDAARSGNVEFIHANLAKLGGSVDKRKTDTSINSYFGFSAIHYAVVHEQLDVLKEVIEREYFLRLPQDQPIVAPAIGQRAQYIIREGTSILHLALLVQNQRIVEFILNYQHRSGKSILCVPDSKGLFSVGILFMIQTDEFVIRTLHSKQMEEELMYDYNGADAGPSHLHVAGIFGRFKLIEHLLEYIQAGLASVAFQQRIFNLALDENRGHSTVDSCKIPMDIRRCNVQPNERQRCIEAMQTLVRTANEYFSSLDQIPDTPNKQYENPVPSHV
ncbi:Ankyrin_repeat protein 1 [Hexamita inflata]|uniref:Ankyrin repeat protein 1 n=1 Tax=Hexamita inflata TaxID=28002 RepID=A0AA86TQC8_9EUKA|nr:Ankyrin repeat protein 1 [Hexamita inflata]